MNIDVIKERSLIEDGLLVDLSKLIEKKKQNLLRVVNSELITLFWKIGNELNTYSESSSLKKSDFPFHTIFPKLTINYGPYFTERNVKRMMQFAKQFSDLDTVRKIGAVIRWEHIVQLLRVEDWESKLFYIHLTVERGLNVGGLRKQLSFNSAKLKTVGKNNEPLSTIPKRYSNRSKTHTQKVFEISKLGIEQQERGNSIIKKSLKEPALSSFHILMRQKKVPDIFNSKEKDATGKKEKLFDSVFQLIENFKFLHSQWLNTNLNLSFWEIGKRINEEIFLSDTRNEISDRKLAIRYLSTQLEKKFHKNFNEKLLTQMSAFAEKISDRGIALRITHLVRWEHIFVLVPLHEIEAMLFYARITAEQGLSVTGLRKKIDKKNYEQTKGAKKREQEVIVALQKTIKKKSIERTGNSVVSITEKYINIGYDIKNSPRSTANISESTYFSLFI